MVELDVLSIEEISGGMTYAEWLRHPELLVIAPIPGYSESLN